MKMKNPYYVIIYIECRMNERHISKLSRLDIVLNVCMCVYTSCFD